MNLALPCAFCDRYFSDFGPLGSHVRTEHPEVAQALREVEVQSHLAKAPAEPSGTPEWEQHGWFSDDMESDDMLPPVGGGKTPSQRSSNISRSRKAPAVPFVTVEDLNEEARTAKIMGVQSQNTGFNDVIVKITMGSRSYFLGLKASNPNYETLVTQLGYDETKWIGCEFTLGLNWNEFYEKNFVHIFEVTKGGSDQKSKKK